MGDQRDLPADVADDEQLKHRLLAEYDQGDREGITRIFRHHGKHYLVLRMRNHNGRPAVQRTLSTEKHGERGALAQLLLLRHEVRKTPKLKKKSEQKHFKRRRTSEMFWQPPSLYDFGATLQNMRQMIWMVQRKSNKRGFKDQSAAHIWNADLGDTYCQGFEYGKIRSSSWTFRDDDTPAKQHWCETCVNLRRADLLDYVGGKRLFVIGGAVRRVVRITQDDIVASADVSRVRPFVPMHRDKLQDFLHHTEAVVHVTNHDFEFLLADIVRKSWTAMCAVCGTPTDEEDLDDQRRCPWCNAFNEFQNLVHANPRNLPEKSATSLLAILWRVCAVADRRLTPSESLIRIIERWVTDLNVADTRQRMRATETLLRVAATAEIELADRLPIRHIEHWKQQGRAAVLNTIRQLLREGYVTLDEIDPPPMPHWNPNKHQVRRH